MTAPLAVGVGTAGSAPALSQATHQGGATMADRAALSTVLRQMNLNYVAMIAERGSDPLFRELAGDELLLRMEQRA